MRLVFLTEQYPYPPNNGFRSQLWNLLTRLSERHKVVVIPAADPDPGFPAPDIGHLSVEPASRLGSPPGRRGMFSGFKAEVRGMHPLAQSGFLDGLRERLTVKSEFPPDVVVATSLATAELLPSVPEEAAAILHLSEGASGHRTSQMRGRGRGPRRVRRTVADRVSGFVTSTTDDASSVSEYYGVDDVEVIPPGVDRTEFRPRPDPGTRSVVFVGSFNSLTNLEAIAWLVKEIWPRVAAQIPRAHLTVVGKGMSLEVKDRIAHPDVEFSGYTADIAGHLRGAAVTVAPMRSGSGIRAKLLEYLSSGVATVSTTLGTMGVAVAHGENILVSDRTADFADEVARLLEYPGLRRRVGGAGAELAARYSWDDSVKSYELFLERAVRAARSRTEGMPL